MVIDANMYWVPESLFTNEEVLARFVGEAPQDESTRVYLKDEGGVRQVVVEKPAGYPALNYAQGDYVLERMLADMDEAGVDVAVLKVPGANEWMSLDTCKFFNDGMAEYARLSGGRMVPLAVIPALDFTPACAAELGRCLGELGFAGVQLCSHYGDKYLDDPAFAPLFECLNEHGATVYVHHVPVPVDCASIVAYNNLRRSYGRVQDQVTAVGRELFSDFFERYPRIRMVHSMLGGAFFAVSEMLLPKPSKRADAVQRFQTDDGQLAARLREHVFFEMSHAQPWGAEQLACAVKTLGADHVVFGTSYPVRREWLLDGPAFVRGLGLSEQDEALVLGGNARALYNLS
ncbi:amidohydrolase family protein [Paratractidigestivibacter sp.]|uniref:amidohydrolase family protein n=1 Tax=Paratractidigestivibacter sp. TaxID=2847316 RepID=UPI002ABE975D|nr:amidohydrolase family protein [Paratractidigestivibacter sp.]